MQASEELIKAVTATAQVMGNELSIDAARMICEDLSDYPESLVMKALQRTRREVKGRLAVSDVISRIDDGRLGAEEAWAMMPRSEEQTVVLTDEMMSAFAAALPLLQLGEEVAARMAFKQVYERLLTEARAERKPVQWRVSLGWNKDGREHVIARAVELGRLSVEQAKKYLPYGNFCEVVDNVRIGRAVSAQELLKLPNET